MTKVNDKEFPRECKTCNKLFYAKVFNQKYCQSPCKARKSVKSIAEINAGWIGRDENHYRKKYAKCKENLLKSKLSVI